MLVIIELSKLGHLMTTLGDSDPITPIIPMNQFNKINEPNFATTR